MPFLPDPSGQPSGGVACPRSCMFHEHSAPPTVTIIARDESGRLDGGGHLVEPAPAVATLPRIRDP